MKSFKQFIQENNIPNKTIKGYKLFRVNKNKKGKLFPLYVFSNEPIEIGKWVKAKSGEMTDKGKVKSKLGPLAYRPGWHSGNLPIAKHIGEKDKDSGKGSKPSYRPNDQVWAEVEIPADVDWQSVAKNRGIKLKNKDEINPRTAHITDQVPHGGYYEYKTNPNMDGNWIISGEIKVNKVLSDEEVESINNQNGVSDLPRKEPLDLREYGF